MPCSFQDSWLQKKEYKSWIRKDEKCTRKVFCLLCCKAIDVAAKYGEYLEQQRKVEEEKRMMLKRKAADAELETLKKKRKQLQDDISSLLKSADSKAEGAEKFGKLSLISESNALRKRAKEKSTELEKVDKLLEEKAAKTSQQSGQA